MAEKSEFYNIEPIPNPTRREILGLLGAGLAGSMEAEAKKKKPEHSSGKKNKGIGAPQNSVETPLQKQYDMAAQDDLSYIETEKEMDEYVSKGLLVKLPKNELITFDPFLSKSGDYEVNGVKHRKYRRDYCRTWTKDFLEDLAKWYHKKFPEAEPLMVTSAVRPEEVQDEIRARKLSRTAVKKSVHETGATIDLSYGPVTKKKLDGTSEWHGAKVNGKITKLAELEWPGMDAAQKRAMYEHLNEMEKAGMLLVRTEIREPVFHVIVSKQYQDLKGK